MVPEATAGAANEMAQHIQTGAGRGRAFEPHSQEH